MTKTLVPVILVATAALVLFMFWPREPALQDLGSCHLLHQDTAMQAHNPAPTQSDYDRTIAVLAARYAQGARMPMLVNELATRYLQRFQALRDVDDLRLAEDITRAQLAEDRSAATAHARMAAIHIARHRFAEARESALAAGSRLYEIDALEELGAFSQARSLLEAVPEAGMGALLRHARSADNAGQADRAARLIDAAITDARRASLPSMAIAGMLSQRATLALHNGDPQTACDLYTEALTLHPGQVSTLEWLGRWAWHRGLSPEAQALVDAAFTRDPDNAQLASLLAEMAEIQGDAETAERAQAAVEALMARWPDWYRLNQAEALASNGDVEPARTLLAEERTRRQGREWLAAAVHVHTESGDFAAAKEALQTLQNNGVLHPPVLYRAWRYYRARGMTAKAEAAARELVNGRIELNPEEWREVAAALQIPEPQIQP